MSPRTLVLLPVVAGCFALAGCGGQDSAPAPDAKPPAATKPAPAPEPPKADAMAEAKTLFANRCSPCHGVSGAGNGPASAGLVPHPRNFQDPSWQKSVSDEHIEKIITYGGAAVGRSPAMPSNPDLMSKPEVVTALRKHIRGLAP